MLTITNLANLDVIGYTHMIFGGGEQHVKLSNLDVEAAQIELRFSQDSDIIKLALVVDALRNKGCKHIELQIPYFPGARQDRICAEGEPFSARVYATLINNMGFEQVTIFDPHSDVICALINNVRIVKNHKFVRDAILGILTRDNADKRDLLIISPDAGANKKISGLCEYLAKETIFTTPQVVRCDKNRDMATGKILETLVYADDLTDKTCVIVDDICSYGGTFCAIAEALKKKNAQRIHLVVSHDECRAPNDKLRASGINSVTTTTSNPNVFMREELNTFFNALSVINYTK